MSLLYIRVNIALAMNREGFSSNSKVDYREYKELFISFKNILLKDKRINYIINSYLLSYKDIINIISIIFDYIIIKLKISLFLVLSSILSSSLNNIIVFTRITLVDLSFYFRLVFDNI